MRELSAAGTKSWRLDAKQLGRNSDSGAVLGVFSRLVTWLLCMAPSAVRAFKSGALVSALVYCRCWLVFHFACTALYLAPVGELKVRTFDFVASYVEPRFGQRWARVRPLDGRCRIGVPPPAGARSQPPLRGRAA
jgi:hypothetical protein